ncbi:MAG: HprK-related kinase B [endosymbiont of Escarpia spicata]|uniref:HprK-related kinase B n=1 Tax=endosymbiont of Escarpia spicata TaxID=2200908 RepID=A0A370DF27_9GAMM|nr:MAG: HprK-related kinase B [endosymbiont of Escarpia spicata]
MNNDNLTMESAAAALQDGASLVDGSLNLTLGECSLRLRSNSADLLAKLAVYFTHVATGPSDTVDLEVIAIERDIPDLGVAFIDWKREPGKTGRKDAYLDLPDARLVLKVRTGMVFLQSSGPCIAAGPCLQYDNQVINFINAQYMNWLQHRDWLICHASGLVYKGGCLGIAGFSGGGKSTLMLHLMDHDDVSYLTNDRLFIRSQNGGTGAVGIPKLPRVNPGTIVHNPRLHSLISSEQRESFLALPQDELWHLEDKYDVLVEQVYGPDRITPEAPLSAFLILNWRRDSNEATSVERVDLEQRRDLLTGAIMKSPGPFYQYPDGSFFSDTTELDQAPYPKVLKDVTVYEARGGINFEALTDICLQQLMG